LLCLRDEQLELQARVSLTLIAMIDTSKFFFLSFVTLSWGSLTFPLEQDVLNTLCVGKDGAKGVHQIYEGCAGDGSDIRGFIKFVGPVVCCVETFGSSRGMETKPGERSKRYCDLNGVKNPYILDYHIVNGAKSDVEEYPHMVALGYNVFGDIEFNCGASLISEKFLITAAHCTNRIGKQPVVARIGRVSQMKNFPDFSPSRFSFARLPSISMTRMTRARSLMQKSK
jgi:Trypsin